MNINLDLLPAPSVIEVIDFETLLAERKAQLLAALPAALRPAVAQVLQLESEPITALLQENAYREMILRQRINEAARAVLLAHARGADLDNAAANMDTVRKTLRPADPSTLPPTPAIFEPDNELRERAQMAYDKLSVAGPRAAYRAHALAAHAQVADASAESPKPCEVVVSVLAREGNGIAPAEVLNAVRAVLSDEDIRPLGDRLSVQSAEVIEYRVEATLYLYPGPEAAPIQAAATASLQRYIQAQRRIGRDIRKSALFAALHVEGVQRVELAQPPADIVIGPHQAGYCTQATLAIGGSDE